ncbi:MAG: hypothetical protein COV52_01990 [Gammaproteobacteria bacterium CG11_big_fil_rev_8_21_14_0_20_46_22]|nr:MAG: hypothetical protein COW05_05885 [Gammaproteobacteria bacterium CG12_big_fil_rev_8_21_14_0_65_46_12]PIR11886.1 MAG: hypothetical protein COV52_01990 [Gammaproteobacteria bacterium CG11_big_fil_rev_8_21_14_0_20_46_22]
MTIKFTKLVIACDAGILFKEKTSVMPIKTSRGYSVVLEADQLDRLISAAQKAKAFQQAQLRKNKIAEAQRQSTLLIKALSQLPVVEQANSVFRDLICPMAKQCFSHRNGSN